MSGAPVVAQVSHLPLCGGRRLSLSRVGVMGVLNVTPDSFSDGGRFLEAPAAIDHALALAAEGAAVLDVGGESTRPGAPELDPREELARVLPVIEALAARPGLPPISIDTRKGLVAREALAAGAALVNDVSGAEDPALVEACAEAGAPLIIGHIQGTPATMQASPRYDDVVREVGAALQAARRRALRAGLPADVILVDPGIGFGKTLAHNLALLRALPRLAAIAPLVVGLSRKSMLDRILGGRPALERLHAGLGGAVWCALHGASLIRTHDVRATVDALRVIEAIQTSEGGSHVE